ncbi:MAG: hypothetical protein U0556_10785 [Dehalococcoidia bacterium]
MAITILATISPLRDQFRLVRVVSSTESTDEYLAVDRKSGAEALVQVIRPGAAPSVDARESILGRLASAAAFERPDVLPIRQVSLDDDRVVVVRDWPGGASLASALSAGAWPVDWSAAVVGDALRAVEAAIGANVAHPGLSPGNVFAWPDGRVQVSDFGLPLLPAASVLPGAGETGGALPMAVTVRAPELVAGRTADLAAQQFAAAAIFAWLVSGRAPFAADTIDALRERQRTSTPDLTDIEGLPASLAALVGRSLALVPSDRIGALGELLKGLDALRPKSAVVATPRPRRRWFFFGGAGLAAATTGLLVFGGLQAARLADEGSAAPKPVASDVVLFAPQAPVAQQPTVQSQAPALPATPSVAERSLERAHACWGNDWACTVDALSALAAVRPADQALAAQLATARVNQGMALAEAGDIAGANDAFSAALAGRPGDPVAAAAAGLSERYLDGAAAYDRADWDRAIRSFGMVAATDPGFGNARSLLYASLTNGGTKALRDGDLARAAALCGQAQGLGGGPADTCLATVRALSAPRPAPVSVRSQVAPLAIVPTTLIPPPTLRSTPAIRHRTTWLP